MILHGACLKLNGVCGAVRHAKLAQAECGGQVGGKQASAQHDRLVCIQMPANMAEEIVSVRACRREMISTAERYKLGLLINSDWVVC